MIFIKGFFSTTSCICWIITTPALGHPSEGEDFFERIFREQEVVYPNNNKKTKKKYASNKTQAEKKNLIPNQGSNSQAEPGHQHAENHLKLFKPHNPKDKLPLAFPKKSGQAVNTSLKRTAEGDDLFKAYMLVAAQLNTLNF